jgi:hypothetical protein
MLTRAIAGATAISALQLGSVAGTDLRVVDSQGTSVVVTGAVIVYGGMLSTDRQEDGIRLRQGDGVVLLKWSAVDTLKVTKVDDSTRPATMHVEVVLRSGTRHAAMLLNKGSMQLLGKTALGDYSIELAKVRMIVPVQR